MALSADSINQSITIGVTLVKPTKECMGHSKKVVIPMWLFKSEHRNCEHIFILLWTSPFDSAHKTFCQPQYFFGSLLYTAEAQVIIDDECK